MATAVSTLTLEEFRARYAGQKPHYEYWFGEAIQKTVGTWLHGVLQAIVSELLRRAGYKVATELELRIDPQWEPVPDVAASEKSITGPYPTEPLDVVVEVLSPDDRMQYVYRKCREYDRIGIVGIFVLDPEEKLAWAWSRDKQNLERIAELLLPNGRSIPLQEIWHELASRS